MITAVATQNSKTENNMGLAKQISFNAFEIGRAHV